MKSKKEKRGKKRKKTEKRKKNEKSKIKQKTTMNQKKSNQKNEEDKMGKINKTNDKKSKKRIDCELKSYGSNESKTENEDSGEFEVEKKFVSKKKLNVKNGKLHFWHLQYNLSLWLRVFEPCLCGRLKYSVLSTHSEKNNSWLNVFFKNIVGFQHTGSVKAYSSSIWRQLCSFLSVWKLKSDSWSFLKLHRDSYFHIKIHEN